MRILRFLSTLLLFVPGGLAGQSVLSSGGLGFRLEPLDAVQRALGGVGPAARTATVLPGEPTSALDLLAPTVSFTLQPTWGDYTLGSDEGDFRGTRFPVLGLSFPVGIRGVLTVTAGSVFDQRWNADTQGVANVAGEQVPTTDRFTSDGGMSAMLVGFAQRVGPSLALGASIGLYRGQVTRIFTRSFDSLTVSNPITPFVEGGKWTYSGPLALANISWEPSTLIQVGATIGWSGTINAQPTEETEGAGLDIDAPLEIRLASTVLLSPALSLTAGIATSNWGDVGDARLDSLTVGRVTTLGAGLEWNAGTFWAGTFPLRLGVRRTELPFSFQGASPTETTISAGFSVFMAQSFGIPLAALDLAIESGSRSAGDLKESFRRLTVTLRVGGG